MMPSLEEVSSYLKRQGHEVLCYPEETPTVQAAAAAVGCRPAEIAKSVLLMVGGQPVLVLACGDRKVNSSQLKKASGLSGKVRFPDAGQLLALVGYPAGGVCPFLLPEDLPLLLDDSLRRFATVYPAAGDRHSAVAIPVDALVELTGGRWAEVTVPL